MPLPTFTQTGVTTFTFSIAPILPSTGLEVDTGQLVLDIEDGTFRAYRMRYATQDYTLVLPNRPKSEVDNLLAFLSDSLVDYSANAFTYTDSDGLAHTVHFIGPRLAWPRAENGTFTITIRLREVRVT